MRFEALIDEATDIVRARRRVSLRALQLQFDLDADTLEALRAELVEVRHVVDQREGGVLEWRGDSGSPPRPDIERRQITVLFCDLVGSTWLAGRLDPEDLHAVVRRYQMRAAEVIERFDGYIAQYLGDGILVYFGWPTAHEDDAVRAVNAALGVVDAVARLGDELAASALPRIEVRVGVHTGAVVVGEVGAGRRFESLALGETPNVGARIQAEARPGTVVISEDVRRVAEGFFRLRDLGARELRGVGRPITLYEVLGGSGARGRIDAAATRGLTPLVDRERERAVLRAAYEAACAGQRTAVLLRGEAGIGKSRLEHWVKQSLATGDRALLECRCSPYHVNTALHPVAEALSLAWELPSAADAMARVDAVVRRDELAPVDEARALLAKLVGVPASAEQLAPIAGWTPQRARQRTFQLLIDLVKGEARTHPVLFVVEDLHWIDPSTHELVDALFEATERTSLLLVMTARPEVTWSLEGRPGAIALDLPRFDREQAAELARRSAGSVQLASDLAARLAERTDGVPLFVEELTRTVIDAAEKAPDSQTQPTITDRDLHGPIPSTLYGCLMARLDRLDVARAVAQVGAALGRTFTRPLLRAVCDLPDAALDDGLQQAVDAQILSRTGQGPDATYAFRHALIQEAALQSVVKRALQQLHSRIGDAIVARFPEIAENEPERVATHYTDAEAWAQAIDWWRRAGLAAIMRFANAEAIAHLTRALSVGEHLPAGGARDAAELTLRVLLAVPLTMTRGWAAPDVEAQYRRAEELCARLGDTPQLFPTMTGLLTYYIVSGQLERASEMAVRNLAVAEAAKDVELRLEGHHDRGTTSFYLGRLDDARAQLDRCLALYVPEKHHHHVLVYGKDPGAVARVHLAMVEALAGRVALGRAIAREAVALTEQWPHPFSHLWALCAEAAVGEVTEDFERARDVGLAIVRMAQEQGFPNWLGQGLCYAGHGAVRAGGAGAEEALAQIRGGIDLWNATGAKLMLPFFQYLVADARFATGDAAGAREAADEAIATTQRTGEAFYLAEILRLRGAIALASEGRDAARAYFERALDDARARNATLTALRAAASLAPLLADAGDAKGARERLAPLLDAVAGEDCRTIRDARAAMDRLES